MICTHCIGDISRSHNERVRIGLGLAEGLSQREKERGREFSLIEGDNSPEQTRHQSVVYDHEYPVIHH